MLEYGLMGLDHGIYEKILQKIASGNLSRTGSPDESVQDTWLVDG